MAAQHYCSIPVDKALTPTVAHLRVWELLNSFVLHLEFCRCVHMTSTQVTSKGHAEIVNTS